MAGIKETLEMLNGVEIIVKVAGKALEDGKLTFADLTLLAELGQKYQELIDAVLGAGEILEELKDLDEGETKIVIGKLFEIINPLRAAILANKKEDVA